MTSSSTEKCLFCNRDFIAILKWAEYCSRECEVAAYEKATRSTTR